MGIFQRHKQGIVRQPVLLGFAEFQIGFIFFPETGKRRPQHVKTIIIHAGIVYPTRVFAPDNVLVIRRCQIALLFQPLEINEIGISGVDGKGLVRGIAVAGRRQRQDLPHLHTAVPQEIGKHIGRIAQLSDAEF